MLHASGAVGPSGGAHLFLGNAGTGKSTIVTRLLTDGWLLLDDDGIRLTNGGSQGFVRSATRVVAGAVRGAVAAAVGVAAVNAP
jgi:hypothetical protein